MRVVGGCMGYVNVLYDCIMIMLSWHLKASEVGGLIREKIDSSPSSISIYGVS